MLKAICAEVGFGSGTEITYQVLWSLFDYSGKWTGSGCLQSHNTS